MMWKTGANEYGNETKTRTLKNKTGRGNVSAVEIVYTDTPHATGGAAHVKLVRVFRGGARQTAEGGYHPTYEAADKAAWELGGKAIKAGFEPVEVEA